MQSVLELDQQFGIADALRFEESPQGMVRAIVSTRAAEAVVYLQGAHIASWTPSGQRPVLFLSSNSQFIAGKAIRGGVPIIFPWFNARGDGLPGPSHGFARTTVWALESASLQGDGNLVLGFLLTPDEISRSYGFDNFELRFRTTIGTSLHMQLETRNLSRQPLTIREALHSYFSVSDVRQISVTGLENTTYIDHADQDQRKQQPGVPFRLSGETDRLFLNTESRCVIEDPAWQRHIVIEKSGSRSTVVWNPWLEKASHLADLGADQWPHMVCVETANAADNTINIDPDQSHQFSATVRVQPIG
jgi:glucose-6-phosphate 1-epimerase